MRIVIPTTGSVGDVLPFVALGVELQAHGHEVRLATHADFAELVRSHRLDFFAIEEDSRAFHALEAGRKMIEAGGNPFAFLRQFARMRRPRMYQLMARSLLAAQGADLVLGSATAFLIGFSVAEKLGIPFLTAAFQPTKPSCFLTSSLFPPPPPWAPLAGLYNLATYFLAGEILWQLLGPAINQARQEVLGLPPYPFLGPLAAAQQIPVLHAYSAWVAPSPRDWGEDSHPTGYWFLKRPRDWKPPALLIDFLESGPPPVCVGFGSMSNHDPREVSELVVKALTRTKQRGILIAGWGGLEEIRCSDQFLVVDSVPHDWLFARACAVVHHGGAGTTAAGLRAGVPSVIVPFMADQPFWGRRVAELGVGPAPIARRHLTAARLAEAVETAVRDPRIRQRAALFGRRIRKEDGAARAVAAIHRHVDDMMDSPSGYRPLRFPGAAGPALKAVRHQAPVSSEA